jgi:hypothetical protein
VFVAHGYQRRSDCNFVPTGRAQVLHHHAAIHGWHLRSEVVPNELTSPQEAARLGYVACEGARAWLVNEAIDGLSLLPQRRPIAPGEPLALERGQQLLVSATEPAHLWWIDRLVPP